MVQPLPNLVNVRALVERRADVVGRCAVAKMDRLHSLLGSDQGNVDVALTFGKSEEGWPVVTGTIQGEVVMQCQRCLGLLPWPVHTEVALALVASEDEAQQIGDSYDPCRVSEGKLSIHELVEDELILAIPQIARHADGACQPGHTLIMDPVESLASQGSTTTPDESKRDRNPFDVLAGLKTKH